MDDIVGSRSLFEPENTQSILCHSSIIDSGKPIQFEK
jgi:hypothetical protein